MKHPEYVQKKAPAPVFVAAAIVIFFFSLSAADSVGFVPCYIDGSECIDTETDGSVFARGGGPKTIALAKLPELGPLGNTGAVVNDEPATPVGIEPERIRISAIDLDLPVQNPQTREIAELDKFLKDGPVRFVDSAKLGDQGNVLIFAHTSHLPVVKNQMYKAFNRVPELVPGDAITVEGDGRSYVYNVISVRKVDAAEGMIDLSPTQGRKLTLVTCDTLTGKSARFVLEADFVAVL